MFFILFFFFLKSKKCVENFRIAYQTASIFCLETKPLKAGAYRWAGQSIVADLRAKHVEQLRLDHFSVQKRDHNLYFLVHIFCNMRKKKLLITKKFPLMRPIDSINFTFIILSLKKNGKIK
jgi:hypothetical protein